MLKYLFLFLLSSVAYADCVDMGKRQYDSLVVSLVGEGKGSNEINQILRARTQVCRGECMTEFGICILEVEKSEK